MWYSTIFFYIQACLYKFDFESLQCYMITTLMFCHLCWHRQNVSTSFSISQWLYSIFSDLIHWSSSKSFLCSPMKFEPYLFLVIRTLWYLTINEKSVFLLIQSFFLRFLLSSFWWRGSWVLIITAGSSHGGWHCILQMSF